MNSLIFCNITDAQRERILAAAKVIIGEQPKAIKTETQNTLFGEREVAKRTKKKISSDYYRVPTLAREMGISYRELSKIIIAMGKIRGKSLYQNTVTHIDGTMGAQRNVYILRTDAEIIRETYKAK